WAIEPRRSDRRLGACADHSVFGVVSFVRLEDLLPLLVGLLPSRRALLVRALAMTSELCAGGGLLVVLRPLVRAGPSRAAGLVAAGQVSHDPLPRLRRPWRAVPRRRRSVVPRGSEAMVLRCRVVVR